MASLGQGMPPCPDAVQGSPGVLRLCQEALPLDGSVVVQGPEGGPCRCECPDLLDATIRDLRKLRYQRDSMDRVMLGRFFSLAMDEPTPACIVQETRGRVDQGGGLVWSAMDTCAFEKAAIAVIRDVLSMRFLQLDLPENGLGGFTIVFESEDRDLMFPVICPTNDVNELGGAEVQVKGRLIIPRRFMRDESVGMELFTFLLLHELAHGTMARMGSEAAADWKAAHVFLPDLVGPTRAFEMRQAAVAQMRAYLRSQFGERSYALADACDAPLNCYPGLDCRTAAILDPLVNDGLALRNGFPISCWEPSVPNQVEVSSYRHRMCEPLSNMCPIKEVCDLKTTLDGITEDMGVLWDPCKLAPIFCKMDAKQLEQELRERVSLHPFRMYRVRTSIKRLSRRAHRLRSVVLGPGSLPDKP